MDDLLKEGIVVVGAGQAGGRAVEAMRAAGFTGSLTLVGEEVDPPYERPSLSKEMLLGSDEVAWVRPREWYEAEGVTLRLGVRVSAIDRAARSLHLEDGSVLAYGALLLATGGRPRPLPVPGADHPRCHPIRALADTRALRPFLQPGAHLVVVGAGFIGLEAASAALKLGARVTVIEATAAVMARCVPLEVGSFYADLHARHGADIRFRTQVTAIEDAGGRPMVVLSGGERLEADAVVVGIGIVPNVELARDAGLSIENGIVVDAFGRTEDPFIWAAGDVASRFDPRYGRPVRLESWQNAQNAAIAVARNMIGNPVPYSEVPWFWSDQHGLNMQICGMVSSDLPWITRGSLATGTALLVQMDGDRPVAAIGMNAARDLRIVKELIALDAAVPAGRLADPALKLNDLLRNLKRDLRPVA
ncbi:NAD(FAD)-dependent dehydrogenase [Roseomonas sp. KE2513]|uniref:NAD(P)/FAD-dependent oxidoreductase n=1 Tax=Roseomonas sp. KE2513 TaxID=2479202 RepID=UPI0018DFECAE|nr:FAD-dependent oxidoreductase [Roseomonas sp. KE2513]MBI0537909.1 NAD(FAD)-dependent dehydrogenase [Roseomonas sp. KE2513]